jgi:hypothetical protein
VGAAEGAAALQAAAPPGATFKQQIKADDALRTGAYSKTPTFTLPTTPR